MARPSTAQPATNTGRVGASPTTTSPVASSTALAASTGLPPCELISRPTFGDTSPEISSPSDSAPTMDAIGHPVSAAIGAAITAVR